MSNKNNKNPEQNKIPGKKTPQGGGQGGVDNTGDSEVVETPVEQVTVDPNSDQMLQDLMYEITRFLQFNQPPQAPGAIQPPPKYDIEAIIKGLKYS